MTHLLILGAYGQLARHALPVLLAEPDVAPTLYLRRAYRLDNPAPERVRIVEGDVRDPQTLAAAMAGQDVVYANLAGADLALQAAAIVTAMQAAGVRRLIFVSSMGIYDEVPQQRYRSVLDPYRDAAAVVEASGLDYTVLRPGWFTTTAEVRYRLTGRDEPFVGDQVSLDSLAHLITRLVTEPGLYLHSSLGVSRG